VYVADSGNNRIREITPAGFVSTLAGSTKGYQDGAATVAQFNDPWGVAVDASGNVYVGDSVNNRIRAITPAGAVTTIAGSGTQGYLNGIATVAWFDEPMGVAVDTSRQRVYVADLEYSRIREISNAASPSPVPSTSPSAVPSASPSPIPSASPSPTPTPSASPTPISQQYYVSAYNDSIDHGWFDTGLILPIGATFSVTASGTACIQNISGSCAPGGSGGPNGLPIGLYGGLPYGALVGRIGGGTAFFVGSSLPRYDVTVITGTNDLEFGYNDIAFGDNSGGFTVNLIVTMP
jgi:hypothetical protein